MPFGPGKYDALCTHARVKAQADAVIVVVLGGNRGNGFSVQTAGPQGLTAMLDLPRLLRSIADEIEADTKSEGSAH